MDHKSRSIINVIISCQGRVRSWFRRRKEKKKTREKSFEVKEKSDDNDPDERKREVEEGELRLSGVSMGRGGAATAT